MRETPLVTGGTGFIGSHLIDGLLADSFRVRLPDDPFAGKRHSLNPRAGRVLADVADCDTVAAATAGATGVFPLAGCRSGCLLGRDLRRHRRRGGA